MDRCRTQILTADEGLIDVLLHLVGKRNLIITSKSHAASELIRNIQNSLENCVVEIIGDVSPNPTASAMSRICNFLGSSQWDVVVAIGGGSVIDVAKIVSVYINSNLKLSRSDLLSSELTQTMRRKCRLIVAPTTAGTGAEVTHFATVWDDFLNKKHSVVSEELFPDYAILDPNLLRSVSADLALTSCLDATAHCLETLWNRNRTSESELFAREGLELICKNFPMYHSYCWNKQQSKDLQTAAMLGGRAISINRTALSHSISYPLTSHLGIPHGLAVGFTLTSIFGELSERNKQLVAGNLKLEDLFRSLSDSRLNSRVLEIASRETIMALVPKMLESDRATNFIEDTSLELVKNVLSNSLKN